MGEPEHADGYRLGIAVDGDHVAGALVNAAGAVVAATEHRLTDSPSLSLVLSAVLDPLVNRTASAGPALADIDRVMFAVNLTDGLATFPHSGSRRWPWQGELEPVAVVRLGAATTAVPPLALWPPDLRHRVALAETCVTGGAMLDGTEFEPLDTDGLATFARDVAGRVAAVAVTGVFSNVTPRHELDAAAILAAELGSSVPIVMSHECGGLGLLERENFTVLQAALTEPAGRAAAWLQSSLVDHGLGHAEVFFARPDGTVMALDYAATHPLLLYGGVDGAMARGAARLSGDGDALVAFANPDGTPRSVCAVTAGRPQLTSGHTRIVGVPTTMRAVALVPTRFGEDATESDAPVVTVTEAVIEAVDRAKGAPKDLPLLLAGPGAEALAAALPPRLTGTVGVRCPEWAHASAAVGVATAPVSGEAERIVTVSREYSDQGRQTVFEEARATAVRAGADPRHVVVTTVEESPPLGYLADPAVLVRATAEGPPRSDVVVADRWQPRLAAAPAGKDGN